MIICEKCGKENQNHYKFCLGCGHEIKAVAEAPPAATEVQPDEDLGALNPTPPAGMPQTSLPQDTDPEPVDYQQTEPLIEESDDPVEAAPPPEIGDDEEGLSPTMPQVEDAPPPDDDPAGDACPSCGTPNPPGFVFCGNCGHRLQDVGGPATVAYPGTAARPESSFWGRLALIRPDGSEGGSHVLTSQVTVVGRGSGPLFDSDGYLSPSHTEFRLDGGRVFVNDVGSLNGVFVKITQPELVDDKAVFRIGQELLRFDLILEPETMPDNTEIMGSPNPGYWGRLSLVVGPNADGSAFPLMGEEVVLGRDRGDILFPDDGYVSGVHAKLTYTEEGFCLSDMGSSNGTFLRIPGMREIQHGDFVLMGQQLFRFEMN